MSELSEFLRQERERQTAISLRPYDEIIRLQKVARTLRVKNKSLREENARLKEETCPTCSRSTSWPELA